MHDADPNPSSINKQEMVDVFLKNKNLPHLSIDEFRFIDGLWEHGANFDLAPITQVPVDRIVISSSLQNWGDIETADQHHLDSLMGSYQLLQSRGALPRNYSLRLKDWGGAYAVDDGQKRVIAAKALGISTLPARVIRVMPTYMNLTNETMYQKMQSRKEQGLWQGDIKLEIGSNGQLTKAYAQVFSYEGIWVLADHMEQVKQVYQSVGASGQAELFI